MVQLKVFKAPLSPLITTLATEQQGPLGIHYPTLKNYSKALLAHE